MLKIFEGKLMITANDDGTGVKFETDDGMKGAAPNFSTAIRVFQRLCEARILKARSKPQEKK